MAKEFFLPVPHYLQVDCYSDTNQLCGAACAQMVLHDIDPQRPFTKGEQGALYTGITIKTTPPTAGDAWYNPPQGIKRVLNQEKPSKRLPGREPALLKADIKAIFAPLPANLATTYEFVILGDSSPETNPNPGVPRAIGVRDQIAQIELLSRQIIRTVAINGAAPIVAVREDNAHWIVVNGFWVDDDYRDADLRQRDRIKAILIRNPLGRYTYHTITCGSFPETKLQEITGHKCELNQYAQDVAPYATWVREYMFSDWAETFVEVCDWSAQVDDNYLSRIHCLATRDRRKSATSAFCDWIARAFRTFCNIFPKRRITPNAAVDRAKRAIEDFNLSRLNPGLTPQNAFPPNKSYKVKRLDHIDGDYYLVPVGVENKISALINISITGEFDGATVWPINTPREFEVTNVRPDEHYVAQIKQDQDIVKFYGDIARRNEHYIAPFDEHPDFKNLTSGEKSSLSGRTIRLTEDGPPLTIKSVSRDDNTPYVWRPVPESFSASRPFHNLKLTVQGHGTPISLYLPVDNCCLPVDSAGVIVLPPANYVETLAECIKERAGTKVDEVLVGINRNGDTAQVMYKSNQTMPIEDEKKEMKKIICECLQDHRYAGLKYFRFKAFATNTFLTRLRGGGEDDPIITEPPSGGGGNGLQIGDCD